MALIIILIVLGVCGYAGWKLEIFGGPEKKVKLLSPLIEENKSNPLSGSLFKTDKKNAGKTVFGFLPYWNLEKFTPHWSVLTHLSYFGIEIDKEGEFNKTDPGYSSLFKDQYQKIKKEAVKNNVKNILTVRFFDNDGISTLVNAPYRRQNFLKNLSAIVTNQEYDGVNLDFEFVGSAPVYTVNNFTELVKETKKALPGKHITVCAYADAAYKLRLQNIKEVAAAADAVVVMAYDYFRPGSITAGPVAPGGGGREGKKYDYDVDLTIRDYLKEAAAEKIILGIPLYGYEWVVVNTEPYSHTLSAQAGLASYNRIKTLIAEKNINVLWDDTAKVPYFNFYDAETSEQKQVYFENERSLSIKFNLIKQAGLNGVALWALGYEGDSPEIWKLLK